MSTTEYCVIKSMKGGINLILDPEASFVDLCTDVCRKFALSKEFFGEATLPISFSGRTLSEEEIKGLCDCIELNSMIKISLVMDDVMEEAKDRRMLTLSERFYNEFPLKNATIITHSIKPDEDVESASSVLVIGDIKEDATVTSEGSIIVMGRIEGECFAGSKGEVKAFVAANEFDSDCISIAGKEGEFHDRVKKGLFAKSGPTVPKAVFLLENELLIEPVKNGALNGKN